MTTKETKLTCNVMSLKNQTMESRIPHLTPPSSHLSHTCSLGGVKMRVQEMRRHVSIMNDRGCFLCQREANRVKMLEFTSQINDER